MDCPLSEVGTGLEQQICSSPHRLIWPCLPGPESKKKPHAGRGLSTRRGTQEHCGGSCLLRPSNHTRAKYHQPHRSGRQAIKYWVAGKTTWHRMPVSHTGGRRGETGSWEEDGKTTNGQRGGNRRRERYTRMQTALEVKEIGGDLGGGREGGTRIISGRGSVTHQPNNKRDRV